MEDKNDKMSEFIELRAKGNSFDTIAERLHVSKNTLISWSKQLKLDLQNYSNMEADALLAKYKMTKNHQLELLGEQLEKVRTEIAKRDLSEIPTAKLVDMEIKILGTINENEHMHIGFKEEGWQIEDMTNSWEAF